MYDNFFEHVGNHIIDQNYQGIPVEFEPDTSHIQLDFAAYDIDHSVQDQPSVLLLIDDIPR
jgi:hypothetical protein